MGAGSEAKGWKANSSGGGGQPQGYGLNYSVGKAMRVVQSGKVALSCHRARRKSGYAWIGSQGMALDGCIK